MDVNSDGVSGIIGKELAGGYEGTRTRPIYAYSIYALQNGSLVDVTARYPDYFEAHILPALRRAKTDVETVYSANPEQLNEARAEVWFTFAEQRRDVRGDETAGLRDAMAWAASGNPKLQDLALRTLEDIDAPEASGVLKHLRDSGSRVVSEAARMAIERRANRTTQQR